MSIIKKRQRKDEFYYSYIIFEEESQMICKINDYIIGIGDTIEESIDDAKTKIELYMDDHDNNDKPPIDSNNFIIIENKQKNLISLYSFF